LAISICRRAIEQHGLTALRINGSDWFGDLRNAIDDENAASEKSMLHKLGAPDLLLVSDPLPPIGNLSQHQATMLYRLVERRYFAGKITIVTVNVADDSEAESRMGVPTWDRLKHRAWVVRCYWESHRQPSRVIGVAP
jgi:DNA replication protein DnaC